MNPFLGLMHYESAHQPLPSYLRKLERHCLSVKRRSLGKAKIFPVAISRIMAKSCRLSSIFDNCPLNVIPNGVEVSVFKPSHHLYSLQGVDLANSTVFLFSSIDIWDTRKGLQRVIEGLEKVDETVPQALQQVVRELEAQRQVWVDYPVLRDVLDIYQSNRGKRKFITLLVRVLNMF